MAYHFRPSKPKAAANAKRVTKRESVFQVERGPISNQKRDVKQLDEFRSRSYQQRGCNKFQTASQRSGLTIGEKEIGKRFCKAADSPVNQKLCSIQTLPSVDKDMFAAKFIPRCFEYVQNYHHYVLDLNKLEKGEKVPYLTHTDKKNTSSKTGRKMTREEDVPQSCSKSSPSNYFAGLPRRTPKSASQSRRESVSNTTTSDFNLLVNNSSTTNSPRDEQDSYARKDTQNEVRQENDNNTLQDLIISELEDELERKESTAGLTDSQGDSIYQVPNPSTADLRVPSGTPVATPRSSSVHHSFPNLPNSRSREVKSSRTFQGVSLVSSEVRKPHLAAFTTRIPPLKAPDICPNEKRRRHRNSYMPDYQRYRILCDAFRPMCHHLGERGSGHIDRHRPNFVTSEELDYYIDVVNNINAVNAYYSY